MAGLELLEPTQLYDILNQGDEYPNLSNPNYLLLLDARLKSEYAESHIITAKKAPRDSGGQFAVPYDAELECKQYVVVYDSRTRGVEEQSPAVECGKKLWKMGSRHTVKILQGGYEDFSALYPFLRTQKILYMVREMDAMKTYPIEVLPGFLYMGNWRQGNAPYIQKDLKIKGHVNCSEDKETFFREEGQFLMHIPATDDLECDMFAKFDDACDFIDQHRLKNQVVLVFSQLGISRSACIILAYLMHRFKWPLQEAYEYLKRCNRNMRPNHGFMSQLSKWEEKVLASTKEASPEPEA